MKKIKILTFNLICIVISIVIGMQSACIGFATNSTINKSEREKLSFFGEDLYKNTSLICLKKNNQLDDFINFLYYQYNVQKEQNTKETTKLLDFWNISVTDNIQELKNEAAIVLKEEKNISIDSDSFFPFVSKTLLDEENSIVSIAEKDAKFGSLYVYMCLYYEIATSSNYAKELLSSYKYDTITIKQLLDFDFKYNFSETQVPLLLRNYIETYNRAASSAWPALYGNSIQQYADTWTNENNITYHNPNYIYLPNEDCTNFASQCLHAGGLPMTSYVGEENNNGYVDTDTRWFYFTNNTSSGYSIATCWVRVAELYNYLSPHYACCEKLANDNMTPYLNKGFLLQGKHFIGSYKHSVIVTIYNNDVCYCAHSNPKHHKNISVFYDGFYKCRVVQVY